MIAFIIGFSIAFSIFCITGIVVFIRRRQKNTQNVGYIVNQSSGAPVTVTSASHTAPGGGHVTHYPPPGYQPPGYQPPGYQPPGYQQPGYQQPGYQQPGYQQPGFLQPGVVTTSTMSPVAGVSVLPYSPPSYQPYPYAAQNTSQVTVQIPVAQAAMTSGQTTYPPMDQRNINSSENTELSVLPKDYEKPVAKQSHQGAVETVSQI